MTVRRLVPVQRGAPLSDCPSTLRERWRATTLAAGWPFPNDWGVPAVDAVCEVAASDRDPSAALTSLGQARAEAGTGLEETLRDIAALYAVLLRPYDPEPEVADPDRVPSWMVRATALGWADLTIGELVGSQVVDGLTGLATVGYLRTRLAEIYRSARAAGSCVTDRHVLVMVAVDLSGVTGWTRLVPMLLAAEAMQIGRAHV